MATDKLKSLRVTLPANIYIDIPKKKISEVLSEAMQTNKPLYLLTNYYKK